MQVNATIIAAQQAAREARAALLQPKPATPQPAAASFLAELDAQAPASSSSETKPPSAPIQAQAVPAPMRPGSLVDIKI
jgi:hypothetical protein